MSALDEARTAAENARALIDALEEVADFGEDAFADLKQSVNRVFNLLAPFATPPTDDEREALAGIAREAWAHYQAIQDDPEFGGDFEDVLAYRIGLAGFRRRGPFTKEAINAAALELYGVSATYEPEKVRAALEAAERTR